MNRERVHSWRPQKPRLPDEFSVWAGKAKTLRVIVGFDGWSRPVRGAECDGPLRLVKITDGSCRVLHNHLLAYLDSG